MAVIHRSSPGILGIAFAIVLGLLMFTLCVPLCTSACGVAGLAGLAGAGVAIDAADKTYKDKRKRLRIAQQEYQPAATPNPIHSNAEPESDLQDEQENEQPEARHAPVVPQTQEILKAQARVARVCPESLIQEETRVRFTDFATDLFADGIERSDVIRDLRHKVKGDGWTYDAEMRKCLAGIVSLAQETAK